MDSSDRMQWTEEQKQIFNSTGNIKINAVAGSGKTTTVIEYARTRPHHSKILYLAFNKSVKLEAARRFAAKGLKNVKVETAHSLAYRKIVYQGNYKVRSQGYHSNEIVDLLKLKGNDEKHTEFVIANHINKYISYFCNSDKISIGDLNYSDTVSDAKAKTFVLSFQKYILAKAEVFLDKMDKGEIEITHDFYLKKFQLSNPVLNYDYILFDEGQDASAAMLDVFLKQKATKVIVGDTHQQIYSWRFAVNSLQKADFETYNLSTSFRFSQDIAKLAIEVLNFKKLLGPYNKVPINGNGKRKEIKSKAILARTNLGLLLKAIEYVTERKEIKTLYFEGNIHSYTYADDGASLYDVLNLYNGKRFLIKDKLIREMKDLRELEDYIYKTEDNQLSMMVDIVKAYGDSIPQIIKSIKEKHVENDKREEAEMIFSTVHRCKGMEYDSIHLVNDFITEADIKKTLIEKKNDKFAIAKLNEEINLLYVAVTRTKNSIHIPEELIPVGFPASAQIHPVKTIIAEVEELPIPVLYKIENRNQNELPKAYSVAEVRIKHKAAYKPWTPELNNELSAMLTKGVHLKDIAKHFGRTKGAIAARINKLELHEIAPNIY